VSYEGFEAEGFEGLVREGVGGGGRFGRAK